ncbi:MAG: M23 family metallopeptidase [Bacteroidetes bacterium]|nr:M23 family metallopeptidase [Bacteroidota bacterium]
MARETYRYNPETLTFEKHKLTWQQRLWRIFGFFNISLVLGGLIGLGLWYFFPSPNELELERNVTLQEIQIAALRNKADKHEKVLNELAKKNNDFHVVFFDQEAPIVESVWKGGIGGVDRYKHLSNLPKGEILKELNQRTDAVHRKIVVLSKSYGDLATLVTQKEDFLRHQPAIMPLSNQDLTRFSSGFGYRMHPILKIWKMHEGVDFTAPIGTEIYATGDGKIEKAKYGRGFGRHVIIDHGYGYKTIYAHMSKISVRRGQTIKRGELIGLVGNTGSSTGPHLHYEVLKNGRKVDPIYYFSNDLTPEEYEIILNLAKQNNRSFD